MMGFCKDCRWWDHHENGTMGDLSGLYGDCRLAGGELQAPMETKAFASALDNDEQGGVIDAVLITHRDFGCVQFSRRPDKEQGMTENVEIYTVPKNENLGLFVHVEGVGGCVLPRVRVHDVHTGVRYHNIFRIEEHEEQGVKALTVTFSLEGGNAYGDNVTNSDELKRPLLLDSYGECGCVDCPDSGASA